MRRVHPLEIRTDHVADLTFDLVLLETGQRSVSWTDAVYLLTYVLLIASAEYYYRYPIPGGNPAAEQRPRTQPVSPLPYLALLTAYGLLFAAALRPWTDPVSGLAVGAIFITALVVARQVLAVRENVRLLAETAARQNEVRFRSLKPSLTRDRFSKRLKGRTRKASSTAI